MQFYLDKIVDLFKNELKDNLIGIYLHGSLAMGCFNPIKSDIDFIVVVREKLATELCKSISKRVLSLHDEMPNERGIEFSIILGAYLESFVYPTPFELHYSDFHRENYRADESYLCGGTTINIKSTAHMQARAPSTSFLRNIGGWQSKQPWAPEWFLTRHFGRSRKNVRSVRW